METSSIFERGTRKKLIKFGKRPVVVFQMRYFLSRILTETKIFNEVLNISNKNRANAIDNLNDYLYFKLKNIF